MINGGIVKKSFFLFPLLFGKEIKWWGRRWEEKPKARFSFFTVSGRSRWLFFWDERRFCGKGT